jgi:hypothetical protein
MLFSTKANQVAAWGEEGRLAQATEIPSLFHRGSLELGEFHSMRLLQPIVNSLSGHDMNCLSFVTSDNAGSARNPPPAGGSGGWFAATSRLAALGRTAEQVYVGIPLLVGDRRHLPGTRRRRPHDSCSESSFQASLTLQVTDLLIKACDLKARTSAKFDPKCVMRLTDGTGAWCSITASARGQPCTLP